MITSKIFLAAFLAAFPLLAFAQTARGADSDLPGAAPKILAPKDSVALPADWATPGKNPTLSIRLSQPPPGSLLVRRVGNNDGLLYLEMYCAGKKLSGDAEVQFGGKTLGRANLDAAGSLWLSLKPRIGTISINVLAAGEIMELTSPTTLVEVRGRQIFLNGEPFMMKGVTGGPASAKIADYIHTIGVNTLRGSQGAVESAQYGFMLIVSINPINTLKSRFDAAGIIYDAKVPECLDRARNRSGDAIANPNALILQLGNECVPREPSPSDTLATPRSRVNRMLVATRDILKELCPILPTGYANNDVPLVVPTRIDVYMHNSYLDKDRSKSPLINFMKKQHCLPPDGPNGEGRPFVMSEFGASTYLGNAHHAGATVNPVLEKIHAWNIPNRWAEIMEAGGIGGTIYKIDDSKDKNAEGGGGTYGILTADHQPKLAAWEVRRIWRDFTLETRGADLYLHFPRVYHARDCVLTVTPVNGKPLRFELEDFAPRSSQAIPLKALGLDNATDGFRWRMDYTTHSGLVNAAAGAWPATLEEHDFLALIRKRPTAPFLTELFDTEVLTIDGKPAPRTFAEMTDSQNVTSLVLRKRNGVAWLVLITREEPDSNPLRGGITLDIAFKGKVEKVDDITGKPLRDKINAKPTATGMRLKNLQAARIPSAVSPRSKKAFMVPVYRITPETKP